MQTVNVDELTLLTNTFYCIARKLEQSIGNNYALKEPLMFLKMNSNSVQKLCIGTFFY